MVEGLDVGCEGRGALGVRFDKLNELGGEAGKVLEPVERPGAGGTAWESWTSLRFVSILRPFDKLRDHSLTN